MKLRPYQQRVIDTLYQWIGNNDGHPVAVMPTGSGKSHVNAALCVDAVRSWPETRILSVTRTKELLEQNAEKILQHWPSAPMGVVSASLRRKEFGEPITLAGIGSIYRRASDIGHIDLCIVDECDEIGVEHDGMYRTLIAGLHEINPAMRVVGLTATPYKQGHGLITEKPALFDALLDVVTIEELLLAGHLAPLKCKATRKRFDTSSVRVRGGDFVEADLAKLVDTDEQNDAVVAEVLTHAEGRASWLFFCAGVEHSEHMRDALRRAGIVAECVTGDTPPAERARIIADFRSGKVRALTNAMVLTVGFDAPGTDLIAMVRPTKSTRLFMQMVGRGMRPAEGKTDCIVLDFASVVETLGPVTNPKIPTKSSGEAPMKACPDCNELVHIAIMVCPSCGYQWPAPEKPAPTTERVDLHDTDIMGIDMPDDEAMQVTEWSWERYTAKSGKDMLRVTYYGALSDRPVIEYLAVTHEGYAGQKAWQTVASIAARVAEHMPPDLLSESDLDVVAGVMNKAPHPSEIKYQREGKFARIKRRTW